MQLEAHPGTCCGTCHAARGALANHGGLYTLLYGTAGQLTRAAVELAKLWRTDKYLRRLDVRCLQRYCASRLLCSRVPWVPCYHTGSVEMHEKAQELCRLCRQ